MRQQACGLMRRAQPVAQEAVATLFQALCLRDLHHAPIDHNPSSRQGRRPGAAFPWPGAGAPHPCASGAWPGVLAPPPACRRPSSGESAAARPPPAASAAAASPSGQRRPHVHVIYRGRGIRLFRLLVRTKVVQLGAVAALAVPISTFLSKGQATALQLAAAGALVVGAGAASAALWYYSRRYVGELALLYRSSTTTHSSATPGSATHTSTAHGAAAGAAAQQGVAAAGAPYAVRFSVLDFWGNREDVVVPLEEVVPPLRALPHAARAAAALEPLTPVDVEGDRQYYLSLRYGHVADWAALRALLEGAPLGGGGGGGSGSQGEGERAEGPAGGER